MTGGWRTKREAACRLPALRAAQCRDEQPPFDGDAFFAPGAYFFFSNDDIKAGVHRMGRR